MSAYIICLSIYFSIGATIALIVICREIIGKDDKSTGVFIAIVSVPFWMCIILLLIFDHYMYKDKP